ncbi:MAG: acyl-CoA dehydrogenase family protein [Chloroflexi bacterium]|nr:acyl-CoA dehydrogenase family protein [Chloroflexota bacterium]
MAAISDLREIISGDGEVGVEIVRNVRRWVDDQVIPQANELEHSGQFPTQLHQDMVDMGLFSITFPEAYGGLALSFETYSAVIEEVARGWMGLAGIINTSVIDGWLIDEYGDDDQKQRFLPGLSSGELQGAFTITEPNAGSDAQAIRTTAKRDGDDYVLNGNKLFVTNGDRAALFVTMAKTDPEAEPRHRGISAFLVEPDSDGFQVARLIDKLGYKGPATAELFFEDMRVPAASLLGGVEGLGFKQMLSGLEIGRINVASRGVGLAQAAFDAAIVYAQQRETFGKPIAEHQAIQLKLADMATNIRAARLLTRDAARKKDQGVRADLDVGMAKLFATEVAVEASLESMRIHGGVGYTKELSVERLYRDAPLMVVAEGTSEIQRTVIARRLLELYKIDT